ncbi:hypothetical protein D3C71_1046860 [compost metagenome]
MEVRIRAIDLNRLVPGDRLKAELRLPVKLYKGGLVLAVDEAERMNPKSFHEAQRSWYGPVGHDPHDHVHAFRCQTDEVPKIVVRRLSLREGAIRLLLGRVDEIRKLDGVLDEEDRDIVADQIPVAFFGVHLDGKTADVAHEIGRSFVAGDRGKADENWCRLTSPLEHVCPGVLSKRLIRLEIAVRTIPARMHDALWNSLVIEMEDFFSEMEVLHQSGSARTYTQCVLIVGDRSALRCR